MIIASRPPAEGPPRSPGRPAPRHAAPRISRGLATYGSALALVALLVPLHRFWPAQVLVIPVLLVVPGAILLQALRIPSRAVSAFPVYLPCASLVVLICSGAAVDIVGPLVGVSRPLRLVPLLVGLEAACLVLLLLCALAPGGLSIEWEPPGRLFRFAWPLALPVAAAIGAIRLNNGYSPTVAVIAAVLTVAALVAAAAFSRKLQEALLEVILYAAGLAIVWASSLRGDPLYGFDIATEYQRLQEAVTSGVWQTAHPGDAYGAMLSITVLPAQLHALSGVPALLIFKIIYPLIYAFFPVAIFGLARRIVPPWWAFIAAAFSIGQYAFTEMASLARQEIALVIFSALVAAMLDGRLPRRGRFALVGLLGVTLTVCHYSTTYVAITVIGLMLPLQWALSWIRDIPRVSGAVALAFLAVLGGAVIWYGPVTHSDSHVLQIAQTVQAEGLNILPNRASGGSLISAYLQGNTRTPINAGVYAERIHDYYVRERPYIQPLPDASSPQYALRNTTVAQPPIKWRAGYAFLTLSLLGVEQLANLLAAVGALAMVLRRKATVLTRQIGLAALATTLLLAVIRISGTLAVAYGQERAQLQGLVVLAVALCWALEAASALRRAKRWRAAVRSAAVFGLALMVANTVYLVGAVFGGATSVNLSNSGPASEYIYTTGPEVASARWLRRQYRPGDLIYADEYGQVPLASVDPNASGLMTDLTPETLSQHAWVYASQANVVDHDAFALYAEHLATYIFPASFLDANYDIVYTNGSSEVFHR
jgi:uncharacterized membrane protein